MESTDNDLQEPLLSAEETPTTQDATSSTRTAALRSEFEIDGMTCTMCSQAIENAIQQLQHVESVQVNLSTDSALVFYHAPLTADAIQDEIESIGYTVTGIIGDTAPSPSVSVESDVEAPPIALSNDNNNNNNNNNTSNHNNNNTSNHNNTEQEPPVQDRWERLQQRQTQKLQRQKRAFFGSLLGTIPISVITMVVLPQCPASTHPVLIVLLWLCATPVQFLAGAPFYRGAYANVVRQHRAGMDVLIALGTSASYLYGFWEPHFWETSSMLTSFVLCGKWLQAMAVQRTSSALQKLMQLQVKTAIRVELAEPVEQETKEQQQQQVFHYTSEQQVPVEDIQKGDVLKILRGASIPADGIVLQGELTVDESMITGESVPVYKQRNSKVYGGTVCVETSSSSSNRDTGSTDNSNNNNTAVAASSVVLLRVTGVGSDTALAQIVQLVQDASSRTVPIQSFADSVAAVFVPTVCALSLLTFFTWYTLCQWNVVPASWYSDSSSMTFSLLFGIACLVISCPCALGLATPTAVMVGTGVAAQNGCLWKGGQALEVAAHVDTVIFDKTGTLTKGKPVVTDWLRIVEDDDDDDEHLDEQDLLWLLASLERASEHPLAKAIVEYCEKQLVNEGNDRPLGQPNDFEALTGRGASGRLGSDDIAVGNRAFLLQKQHKIGFIAEECMVSIEEDGKTAIAVVWNGKVCAVLGISDEIKIDALAAVAYLRDELNVDVWMVTGDNHRTAQAVGSAVNLPHNRIVAEALPADKLEHVAKLQAEGKTVAMVGDGINDSPALAQADVGMSLGTGAEIANEASDIVLVKGNVTDVCTALDLSRTIFRRIQWNFVWSLFYNCLGIPVAAGVFYPLIKVRLPPTVAALAMAFSSISVVCSSLALRWYSPPPITVESRSRQRRRQRTRERDQEAARNRPLSLDNMTGDDHLDPSEQTHVTDATEPTDNRTLQSMEAQDEED